MEKIKILGYHGTTQENAQKILKDQTFVDSKRNNDWLGTGVYFFSYLGDAEWWISAKRYCDVETCILKSQLEYTKEQLLDLDDFEQLKSVNRIITDYLRKINEAESGIVKINLEKMKRDQKWNFVCNTMRRLCPEIGIIMYTFMRDTYFDVIGFKQMQHQICVSDHSIIGETESI